MLMMNSSGTAWPWTSVAAAQAGHFQKTNITWWINSVKSHKYFCDFTEFIHHVMFVFWKWPAQAAATLPWTSGLLTQNTMGQKEHTEQSRISDRRQAMLTTTLSNLRTFWTKQDGDVIRRMMVWSMGHLFVPMNRCTYQVTSHHLHVKSSSPCQGEPSPCWTWEQRRVTSWSKETQHTDEEGAFRGGQITSVVIL